MEKYLLYIEKKEKEYEDLCLRCGACCGAGSDPCINLKYDGNGKYFCSIYSDRFGFQKTISGKIFKCVPIRDIIHKDWKGKQHCPYSKYYKG